MRCAACCKLWPVASVLQTDATRGVKGTWSHNLVRRVTHRLVSLQLYLLLLNSWLVSLASELTGAVYTVRHDNNENNKSESVPPSLMCRQIYFTQDFGFSDVQAASILSTSGLIASLAVISFGFVVDVLGWRNSLLAGTALLVGGKAALASTRRRFVVKAVEFFVFPLSSPLRSAVYTIATRRCTTRRSRGFTFGLVYAVDNVASFAADVLTDALISGGAGLRAFFWCSMACYACSLLPVLAMRPWVRVPSDEDVSCCDEAAADGAAAAPGRHGAAAPPLWGVLRDPSLRTQVARYTLTFLITAPSSSIWSTLHSLFPKWMRRTHGCRAPFGRFLAINPFLIVFLVPVVSAATSRVAPFDAVRKGLVPFAAAPLLLVYSSSYVALGFFFVWLTAAEGACACQQPPFATNEGRCR